MKYEVIGGINEKCKSMKNHKTKMMKMKNENPKKWWGVKFLWKFHFGGVCGKNANWSKTQKNTIWRSLNWSKNTRFSTFLSDYGKKGGKTSKKQVPKMTKNDENRWKIDENRWKYPNMKIIIKNHDSST